MGPDPSETEMPPAPSFKGRLQLQQFVFQGAAASNLSVDSGSTECLRRSSRLSTPLSAASSPAKASSSPPTRLAGSRSTTPSKKRAAGSGGGGCGGGSDATTPKRPRGGGRSRSSPGGAKAAGYAPPSTYAHLPPLPDALAPNPLVLFVGLNPGIETARQQHAYAHPSNLFWKLLASSGVTPRLCAASEDRDMPRLYGLGLTNIVSRPSRNGAELSKAEMDAGVAVLEAKVRRWRPEVVCLVGKGIWESVWRVRHGRSITKAEFRYGWQDEAENMGVGGRSDDDDDDDAESEPGVAYRDDWKGARVFVATSTSGLAATLRPAEKEAIWRELGVWVQQRRRERSEAAVNAT